MRLSLHTLPRVGAAEGEGEGEEAPPTPHTAVEARSRRAWQVVDSLAVN